MVCEENDTKKAEEEAAGNKDKLKELKAKIRLHKYVGESSRSVYERGWEHLSDFENISTKSHMLKHTVESHPEEELDNIKFGIKIIKSAKSSFERQIFESVAIQENRHHHLLNSRSEYNRCAVPRLTCKLGDKTFKKYETELNKDLAREEEQMDKIRVMAKDKQKSRNRLPNPPPKRRKTEEGYQATTTNLETAAQEKRKQDGQESEQITKRRKLDIRDMFKKQIEKPTPIEEEKETNIPEEVGTSHIVYGELEEVEVINWDEAFKQHLEESARLQQEIDERLEAQNKKKQSWELLRTCVDFIKTNEKIWKIEEEERLTVRQRKERLNKKNQLEKKFKETAKEKETTTKITKIWQRLPELKKRHLLKEE